MNSNTLQSAGDEAAPAPYPDGIEDYLKCIREKKDGFRILPVDVEANRYGKCFNDPVYKFIQIHPLLVKIIDTPQFQRLRYIKALSTSVWVYPSATHTRFEHCLGVSHLAQNLVLEISRRQPELGIDREEILCVAIAGLLHDLGHGPFSHSWEKFMKLAKPDEHYEHETISIRMIHHLIKRNNLMAEFKHYGLNEEHLKFIEELIVGPLEGGAYTTRPPAKHFLFEIVANKRNGLDVDKFDYLRRDAMHADNEHVFDASRFIASARVTFTADKVGQISLPYKDYSIVSDVFDARFKLHYRLYQHRVTKAVEAMILEALLLADKHLQIAGSDGHVFRPSEAYRDLDAFEHLNDSILSFIKMDPRAELQPARAILKRVDERRLYKLIGRTKPASTLVDSEERVKEQIISCLSSLENSTLTTDVLMLNLAFQRVQFDWGMKSSDPLQHVTFYSKDNMSKGFSLPQDEVSKLLPEGRFEVSLLIFYRGEVEEEQLEAQKLVEMWALSRKVKLQPSSVRLKRRGHENFPEETDAHSQTVKACKKNLFN